jgi:hypothetical protein
MKFWTSMGRDADEKKTEHNSPDPHDGRMLSTQC